MGGKSDLCWVWFLFTKSSSCGKGIDSVGSTIGTGLAFDSIWTLLAAD